MSTLFASLLPTPNKTHSWSDRPVITAWTIPPVMTALWVLGTVLLNAACVWSAPTINAPWGTIAGKDVVSPGGRLYSSYLAIPFALPPVGERRWVKPVAHPGPGVGRVYNASQLGYLCPQELPVPGLEEFLNEDCLTLNVFVPDNSPGTKSVMVFIHGGGFTLGSSRDYTPSELVTENDVIVVVIQYRLGILGFLSSGDNVTAGNYGLWDQQLALRWVKDNIRSFGGNPDSVTIFGESAGAASVGYHMLSTYSRGLFSRVLFQSGTSTASFAFQQNPGKAFHYLANQTGCLASTSLTDRMYYMVAGGRQQAENERIVDCLKRLDPRRLLPFTTGPLELFGFTGVNPWVPSMDHAFIPKDPSELIVDTAYLESVGANGIDVMLGMNNDEAGLLLEFANYIPENSDLFEVYKIDRKLGRTIIEGELLYRVGFLKDEPKRLGLLTDILEFFYLKPFVNGEASLRDIADVYSDVYFNIPTIEFITYLAESRKKVAGRSPTGRLYLYQFNHYPAAKAGQELNGVYHAEDLAYQWDATDLLSRDGFNADDFAVGSTFRSMVSNFAKAGDPQLVVDQQTGATWPEFTLEGQKYLSLAPTPRVEERLYAKRVAVWLDLIPSVFNSTQPQQQPYYNGYNNYQQSTMGGSQSFTFRGTIKFFNLP